jgi:hypothetical protein
MRFFAVLAALACLLTGCDQSLSTGDTVSPRADVAITRLATPGGEVLAPVVSSSQAGATTGTVAVDFPPVGVEVTIFNGVSVTLSRFGVAYFREDGVTSLGLLPAGGPMSRFLPAQFSPDGPVPAPATVSLSAVSGDLRSFLAGPDGQLGTPDDHPANVIATISLGGKDINGNDVAATAQLTITSRPQSTAGDN